MSVDKQKQVTYLNKLLVSLVAAGIIVSMIFSCQAALNGFIITILMHYLSSVLCLFLSAQKQNVKLELICQTLDILVVILVNVSSILLMTRM